MRYAPRRTAARKGQNIIFMEILLFGFGILLANFVIVSFQGTDEKTQEIALKDNFRLVANAVSTAVVKASESANSSVRLLIPEKISEKVYMISMKGDSVMIFDPYNPEINASQKLFNITQENCISDNAFCAQGDVISTSKSVEVFSDGKTIVLRRLRIT